jgi:hypothetical protein
VLRRDRRECRIELEIGTVVCVCVAARNKLLEALEAPGGMRQQRKVAFEQFLHEA